VSDQTKAQHNSDNDIHSPTPPTPPPVPNNQPLPSQQPQPNTDQTKSPTNQAVKVVPMTLQDAIKNPNLVLKKVSSQLRESKSGDDAVKYDSSELGIIARALIQRRLRFRPESPRPPRKLNDDDDDASGWDSE